MTQISVDFGNFYWEKCRLKKVDSKICRLEKCRLKTYIPFFRRLQSGWSVKTAIMNKWKQPEPISAEEHEKIRQVVEKAAALEKSEEERLG